MSLIRWSHYSGKDNRKLQLKIVVLVVLQCFEVIVFSMFIKLENTIDQGILGSDIGGI
jgi:hypothetical protein